MGPDISIIVPTHNEEKYLPALLESLRMQTFQDFEVIVADWKSTDRTLEIAKDFGAKIVKCSQQGIGPGRNAGAKAASGKLFIFADADVIFKDKKLLEKIWEKYLKGFLSGTGKVRTYELPRYLEPFQEIFDILRNKFIKTRYFYPGYFVFIDRELFFRVGGYGDNYSEDVEFSRRLSRLTRLNFFEDLEVWVSGRRFKKYGLLSSFIYYSSRDVATALKGRRKLELLLKNKFFQRLYAYRKA